MEPTRSATSVGETIGGVEVLIKVGGLRFRFLGTSARLIDIS